MLIFGVQLLKFVKEGFFISFSFFFNLTALCFDITSIERDNKYQIQQGKNKRAF